MLNEMGWQAKIVKQIKLEGGYARKWAAGFSAGNPDLIVSSLGTGVLFVEVKLFRGMTEGKFFKRKVALTLLQRLELNKLKLSGAKACVLVVCVLEKNRVHFVIKSPQDYLKDLYVSNGDLCDSSTSICWKSARELNQLLLLLNICVKKQQ